MPIDGVRSADPSLAGFSVVQRQVQRQHVDVGLPKDQRRRWMKTRR
jgi:hypothetical protein